MKWRIKTWHFAILFSPFSSLFSSIFNHSKTFVSPFSWERRPMSANCRCNLVAGGRQNQRKLVPNRFLVELVLYASRTSTPAAILSTVWLPRRRSWTNLPAKSWFSCIGIGSLSWERKWRLCDDIAAISKCANRDNSFASEMREESERGREKRARPGPRGTKKIEKAKTAFSTDLHWQSRQTGTFVCGLCLVHKSNESATESRLIRMLRLCNLRIVTCERYAKEFCFTLRNDKILLLALVQGHS